MSGTWRLGRAGGFLFPCCLVVPSVALAQTGTATLRGTVVDATGAVVPGAAVSLISERTKDARRTRGDALGGYLFVAVLPDTYTVTAEAPGFKTSRVGAVAIAANDNRGLDLELEIGDQSETVTVTAAGQILRTETGAREGVLTSQQIETLSVIGRSPLELLRILPGVVAPPQSQMESVGFHFGGANNTSSYTVSGVRGTNNAVTLDGSRIVDFGCNCGLMLSPTNDMVQEVKLQSGNYAAEFGSSAVQISAVTKSGGAEFHGAVYDYLRHHRFAANDRSNVITGVEKPRSSYNYAGANVGGPVLVPGTGFNKGRDRMFFFLGVEAQRQRIDPGSALGVVPTLRQRQGFFDDVGGGQHLNQPATVLIPGGFPGAGSPAPGDDLSPFMDPLGRALVNMFPLPNHTDPDNRYNYVFNKAQPSDRLELTLRLDYTFSPAHRAYLRLAHSSEQVDSHRGLWGGGPNNYELPSPARASNVGRSAALNLISVLSPTITNELLITASRLTLDNAYVEPEKLSLTAAGAGKLQGMFPRPIDRLPTIFDASGQVQGGLWSPIGQPVFAYNDSLQIADNLTKVVNAHVLKFGLSVEQGDKEQNFTNDENGNIILGAPWTPGSTGSAFGDLLVGRPGLFFQGTPITTGRFRFYNVEAYAQDSWKASRRLTLEVGLRTAYMPNNTERTGLGAVFIPERYDRSQGPFTDERSTRVNGVAYAASGDVPKRLIPNRPLLLMPRLSFAWDVHGNGATVIRGGAGIFYNRPAGNAEYGVITIPPNAYNAGIDAFSGIGLGGGRGLTFDTIREVDPFTRLGAQGLDSVNPESIHHPRTATMSLSVSRRLPFQQLLEVGYVGSLARHLLNRRPINVIPPGTLLQGRVGNSDLSVPVNRAGLRPDVVNSFRPFPALAFVNYYEFGATSAYHSLQATLSRHAGRRLEYLLTYTFSKALGTTIVDEFALIDPFDPRNRSYGVLPTDRTHIANLSYSYAVPDLAPRWFDNAVTRGLLNGWQISGISTFSSGIPIRLRFGGALAQPNASGAWYGTPDHQNLNPDTSGAIAPVFLRDPRLGGTNVGEAILDISAIGIPAFGQSGPFQPSYYIRTPETWNHDVTVFKNFRLGGARKLQFRAGFFNVFNRAYASTRSPNDIDLSLNTACNVFRTDVPDGAGGTVPGPVCDPTGGFSFTPQTLANFGKINIKRGHRIVEFALKLYF